MKKLLTGLALGVMICGLAEMASATSINYNYALDAQGNKTSAYSYFNNFELETFDIAPGPTDQSWGLSGSYIITSGSSTNNYAAPFGDTTKYISVPDPVVTGGSLTVTLGGLFDYLGILWGSVDTYNSIIFYRGENQVASYTGLQIAPPADGNQVSPLTNLYVNFLNVPGFSSFKLTSSQHAFEADNIAVGNVRPIPEPATMLLLGTGLAGLAGMARKRKNQA